MSKGKVRYFNDTKGWGFIASDETDQDVYVHHSSINMEGYKTLKEGQEVLYELAAEGKRFEAKNVTPQ